MPTDIYICLAEQVQLVYVSITLAGLELISRAIRAQQVDSRVSRRRRGLYFWTRAGPTVT